MTIVNTMIEIVLLVILFLVSAIPLHLAVKMMGGKSTLVKTAIIILISGIAVSFIEAIFAPLGGLIAFIVLLWIYREMFRLKWWKALFVWFFHLVFVVVFWLIMGMFIPGLVTLALL